MVLDFNSFGVRGYKGSIFFQKGLTKLPPPKWVFGRKERLYAYYFHNKYGKLS